MKTTAKSTAVRPGNWSHPPGSNRRPADYESVIGITEINHRYLSPPSETNRIRRKTPIERKSAPARLDCFAGKVLRGVLQ